MSQQKIAPHYYLVLQSTYDVIEVGLGAAQQLLGQRTLNKIDANRDLILTIDQLLKAQNLSLDQLSFIAANLGPAPFTSLRVVIVTVNGLAYATGVPLIGVNGLQALVTENTQMNTMPISPRSSLTLALLNAYNHDLYYGILDQTGQFTAGWGPAIEILPMLAQQFKTAGITKINLIGNGASLFPEQIKTAFAELEIVNSSAPVPQYCSLAQIARLGYQSWQTDSAFSAQLQPLYLKTVQTVVNKNYGQTRA